MRLTLSDLYFCSCHRGQLGTLLAHYQTSYLLLSFPHKTLSIKSDWDRITTAAFLEFEHSLWKFRNDTKFGRDKLENARLIRIQLEQWVSALYTSQSYLLPKFIHLVFKPLADWLLQGDQTLSAWLRHLTFYATISSHVLEHGGRQRDFRSYLSHIPGFNPPRFLDVAAERALRKWRRAITAVPKLIRNGKLERNPMHNLIQTQPHA